MTITLEIIGLVATVIAIVGVCANNRRMEVCFWLWLLSNGLTAYVHAHQHIWSLCLRDIVFAALAIEGLYLWSKDKCPKK